MSPYKNASKATIGIASLVPSSELDLKLVVTLDSESYESELHYKEHAAIERRLQQAGPTVCTPAEFCEHVANGGSWTGEVRKQSEHGWGKLFGQQLFSLDFNNGGYARVMERGYERFLSPEDAYARALGLGLIPLCIHHTGASMPPDFPTYRIVFALKTVVDEPTARVFNELLHAMFPEASRPGPDSGRLNPGAKCSVLGPWFSWERNGGGMHV